MIYPMVEAKDVTVNYIASALRNAYIQVRDIEYDDNLLRALVDELLFEIKLINKDEQDMLYMLAFKYCVIRKESYKDICHFLNENINQVAAVKFFIVSFEKENLSKEQVMLYFFVSGYMRFDYGFNIAQLISDLRYLSKVFQHHLETLVRFLDKENILVDL